MLLAGHRWNMIRGRIARRSAAERGAGPVPRPGAAVATEAPPDSLELERAPAAVVRALFSAFGPSLTLVYLAQVDLRAPAETPERAETLMLQACARIGVDCVSTRARMADALRQGNVTRGLGVMPLGHGHLNPVGHQLVANLMWDRLSESWLAARSR